jgi:methionyl-tRNA synthetase
VPLKGYEGKVFYVWFDAPIGYIGISMEWARQVAGDRERWRDWWKNPSVRLVQFMAKDNIPFHTVTWPATMMGADDGFILADFIKGFEWLNYEGGKFSTSANRGVFTDRALELFPPDYWRYALVFMAPEGADTNFTWEKFQMAVNKDLADNLGNFVNRVLSFTLRFAGGVIPKRGPMAAADEAVIQAAREAVGAVSREYEGCELRKALLATRELWDACNRYFEAKKPWEERKKSPESMNTTLSVAAHLCRTAAILCAPLIPFTAQKILDYLGDQERVEKCNWTKAVDFGCLAGNKIASDVSPLFTKIEDSRVAELKREFAGKESE